MKYVLRYAMAKTPEASPMSALLSLGPRRGPRSQRSVGSRLESDVREGDWAEPEPVIWRRPVQVVTCR